MQIQHNGKSIMDNMSTMVQKGKDHRHWSEGKEGFMEETEVS